MPSQLFAKTVLMSSLLTFLVIAGVLYVSREPLLGWLQAELQVSLPKVEADPKTVFVSHDSQIRSVVAKTNPAVVSVIVTKDVPVYERFYEDLFPFGGFGGFSVPRLRESGTEEREVGGGSGFLVSEDGLIVTNRHVVSDESARYSVMLADGSVFDALVVAKDPLFDVAILRSEELSFLGHSYLSFGDSDGLEWGQTVIAIGNALAEFQNSVSVGVVSGLSRSIVARGSQGVREQLDQVIQTDAAINLGNSGGPLIDLDGNVIGVNVARSFSGDSIGFALPANVVSQIVESVRSEGRIVRPFLGVRYQMLTEHSARELDLTIDYGALIMPDRTGEPGVLPDSPADIAGLRAMDVIVSVGGRELREATLVQVLREHAVGDSVELLVYRDGQKNIFNVTLAEAP